MGAKAEWAKAVMMVLSVLSLSLTSEGAVGMRGWGEGQKGVASRRRRGRERRV
jgi:hypothetical protein